MGEMLPYMLDRIDEKVGQMEKSRVGLQANLGEEHLGNHKRNVYNAINGVFTEKHEYRQDSA